MSKKKSFSGSTMTLKDFHGGSIPSDLALPSAPGVSARPPVSVGPSRRWGRVATHHRPRPGSAGGGQWAAAWDRIRSLTSGAAVFIDSR
ncbi:uncharacterized protein A4U43_C03F9840 [Asparagus officinalis]|uniref:Uncharacterized protein n=1 Tax=Asparagus officinalis TaxID=4686 RepID=A0A5P1FBH9_ASPOF|nr:uncharacterized protein A4U43_C03F9840 [Asparagus officinalis]